MSSKYELTELNRYEANVSVDIIDAKHNSSLTEQKIFWLCATFIDPLNDYKLLEYSVSVREFCERLKISGDNRTQIIGAIRKLIRKPYEIDDKNGDFTAYSIFSKLKYHHKEQKIDIKFNQDMKPYLIGLKREFAKIQNVDYIMDFRSKYAPRFYAWLKSYRLMTKRTFDLKALRKLLELPESYINFNKFTRFVLNPALKDIDEFSDLQIDDIEIIKERQKVVKFTIKYSNKSQKAATDIVKHLIALYKKTKSFRTFIGLYFNAGWGIEKITKITISNDRFIAFCKDGEMLISYDKQMFLSGICNGIYEAVSLKYEQEKKEQLPTMEWQDRKDRLNRIKEIINEWSLKEQARRKDEFLNS